MFEQAQKGAGPVDIAREANERAFPSRSGKPWRGTVVAKILRNPVYGGTLTRYRQRSESHYWPEDDAHDGRRLVPGAVPAIVPPEVVATLRVQRFLP